MAQIDSTPIDLEAGADLSASSRLFGKTSAAGIVPCDALGERADVILGDTQLCDAAGKMAESYLDRQTKVLSSAAIAKGAELTPAANGKAVTAVATNIVKAKALEACAGADALISVLIVPAYIKP